jgi:ribosomal protein S18 acetylase RimI-like enzyme
MEIREAKREDVKDIESLSGKLLDFHLQLDEYYRLRPNLENGSHKYFEDLVTSEDSVVFVAEDNGAIIGYLAGKIEERSPVFEVDKRGWIDSAYLLEEYRGQEIGKKLTQRMLEWFKEREIEYVEISVDSRNKLGVKVWSSLGFETWLFVMKKRI